MSIWANTRWFLNHCSIKFPFAIYSRSVLYFAFADINHDDRAKQETTWRDKLKELQEREKNLVSVSYDI